MCVITDRVLDHFAIGGGTHKRSYKHITDIAPTIDYGIINLTPQIDVK